MPDSRRLLLRVAVKLMLGLGLLAILWVFINAREKPQPEPAEAFALPELAPGEVHKLQWRGRRILVLAYDPALLERLNDLQEPPAHPGLLVALDYGGELGCPLEWRGEETEGAPKPWVGGLVDTCRGNWYDPLGRIYESPNWGMDLMQPIHRIEGDTLLLGGD